MSSPIRRPARAASADCTSMIAWMMQIGHGEVARVFVDLLPPALAFLPELLQRRHDAADESSWKMIDAEMYGMMPRAKMQALTEVAAGEQRHEAEHLAERAARACRPSSRPSSPGRPSAAGRSSRCGRWPGTASVMKIFWRSSGIMKMVKSCSGAMPTTAAAAPKGRASSRAIDGPP